jgi:hypothetical protein
MYMAIDKESNQQTGTGSPENLDRDRNERLNELSELSLEERMAVADRIGIPVENVSEAAATGTMSGRDDAAEGSTDEMEDESASEETDR